MSEDCAVAITRTSLANAHGDPGDTVTQKVAPQLALGISKAHYGNNHYKAVIILTDRASAADVSNSAAARVATAALMTQMPIAA